MLFTDSSNVTRKIRSMFPCYFYDRGDAASIAEPDGFNNSVSWRRLVTSFENGGIMEGIVTVPLESS